MSINANISFVGGGNMASAIIDSLISSDIVPHSNISVFDTSEEKKLIFNSKGVNVASSNVELAKKDGILILAVKPQIIDIVLNEIKGHIKSSCVVSIAAGVSVNHIKSILGNDIPVIRVLPNTPMLVLDGISVIAESNDISSEMFDSVVSIFKASGEVVVLPENKINEAIPLSSSSPAFFFRMLHAMALEGQKSGISYQDSFKLSAHAMKGAANYALQSDSALEDLVAQVSSPGGTTVAALTAFDDFDFENFISDVFKRCVERAYELGGKQK